jgi:hypothetical protein
MSDVADHFFPPINPTTRSMSNEFSNVNYWRQAPLTIAPDDIAAIATVTDETAAAKTSRKSSFGGSTKEEEKEKEKEKVKDKESVRTVVASAEVKKS